MVVSSGKEASEIPVKKGSQIQVDNISGSIPVCRLEDKDGKKKEYPVQEEKKEYIAVSSIKADPIKMEITTGEKKIITYLLPRRMQRIKA